MVEESPEQAQRNRDARLNHRVVHRIVQFRPDDAPRDTSSGERLTEEQAAASQGAYSLHVRTNAEGFLSVWLSGETEPRQLTPGYGGYNGHMLPSGSDYTVPGLLRFGQNPAARLIVVFSRSQTEQPAHGQGAITRLQTISNRTAQDGLPQIVRDSDRRSPGQVGTYVVNRRGGPVVAEISLRSR